MHRKIKKTFDSVFSIPHGFGSSTIFQSHPNFGDINFLGRWLDGAYLRNHSPKCWFSSFSQSHISTSRNIIRTKLGKIAVLCISLNQEKFHPQIFSSCWDRTRQKIDENSGSVSSNMALRAYFTESYLRVKTTSDSNWWLIIAYKVGCTSAEDICFGRKYFFLGLFVSPTWLHGTGCVHMPYGAILISQKISEKIFSSKTNVFSTRRTNLIRNNKPLVAVKSDFNMTIWCGEVGSKIHVWRHWNTVFQHICATSYLHVKTTLAMNWWLIIAHKVGYASAEHFCFRRKYFFLGLFGGSTWLHRESENTQNWRFLGRGIWIVYLLNF